MFCKEILLALGKEALDDTVNEAAESAMAYRRAMMNI